MAHPSDPPYPAIQDIGLYFFPGDTTSYVANHYMNSLPNLSFRNTMSDANFHSDLEYLQVDVSSTSPECRAHTGFWFAARSAARALARPVEDARVRYPGYGLVMMGHSLGGAIATLYSVSLRSRGVDVDLVVYIRDPSVGNYAFAESITNRGMNCGTNYRVTHMDDEVPKIVYRMSRDASGCFLWLSTVLDYVEDWRGTCRLLTG